MASNDANVTNEALAKHVNILHDMIRDHYGLTAETKVQRKLLTGTEIWQRKVYYDIPVISHVSDMSPVAPPPVYRQAEITQWGTQSGYRVNVAYAPEIDTLFICTSA